MVATSTLQANRTRGFTSTLRLSPTRARVGDLIEVTGSGYPAGEIVDLIWYTVEGSYEFEGGTEFLGQTLEERSAPLVTAVADATGEIRATFEVPVDFGGPHDVRGSLDGCEISQAGLTVDPTITMTPVEGPVGTPVEIRIVGVDWRATVNTWHVLYDNKYFGFMSAVTTRGVAVARFRAAGPIGEHVVSLWRNSYHSTPYLAWQTSPFRHAPGPGTVLNFRTTADGGLIPGYVEDFSATDDPWPWLAAGPASLSVHPDRGTHGETFELQGLKLPPNAELQVRWWTTVGDRITNVGMVEEAHERRNVRTDERGHFRVGMELPDDLGGQHKIDVVDADGSVLGSTAVVILPTLESIGPIRLRAGEEVRIHLKGLGWTTYDNTYTVTYDNGFVGYVCGFSTAGDIWFTMPVVGAPGTHLIDLYPTIYKAKDASRMPRGVYSVPQLTYADDHPQRRTPAVRLAVEIVE